MKKILSYIITFCFCSSAFSQVCEGNLGINIFSEGDFGSGASNFVQANPLIAPGYIYTAGPPDDGFYTVTNNIGAWDFNFGWMRIRDNSNDPNGYMMVVNASFQPGLFYDQVIDGLCENTEYVFTADIHNLIFPGTGLILPNVSFLIDNNVVYSTGNIPELGRWETYGFTFTTQPGQTSVRLALQNNAPGGIGNDLALDNISFQACGPEALILPETVADICEDGEPFEIFATILGDQFNDPQIQWQQSFDEGVTWIDIPNANGESVTHSQLQSGIYYYRYLLANDPSNLQNSKCHIISNVKLINVVPKFYDESREICEDVPFTIGNSVYTESGSYIDTLISSIGCDSIVNLDLTVVPNPGLEIIVDAIDPSCTGFDDGSINIQNIVNAIEPVDIFINGNAVENGSLNNLNAGQYIINVSDSLSCLSNTIVDLEDPVLFQINLSGNQDLILGDSSQINVSSNFEIVQFNWSDPENISCLADCNNAYYLPLEDTNLELNAISEAGCSASADLQFTVEKQRKLYIPNGFSPNNDGINDLFRIFPIFPNVKEIRCFKIYDRWGNLIFDASGVENYDLLFWDGRIDGSEAIPGIYTFIIDAVYLDNEMESHTGDLLLIK